MATILSVSVNGTVSNPIATATTVGLGTSQIRSVENFVGTQPIAGVTILSVIKMAKEGTKVSSSVWLSPTAAATIITAAG